MTDYRPTYEEYLERKRELREAVLKQIGPADERALRYIESISILTEEEWTEIQKAIYGRRLEGRTEGV